jgi:hypothetical protein
MKEEMGNRRRRPYEVEVRWKMAPVDIETALERTIDRGTALRHRRLRWRRLTSGVLGITLTASLVVGAYSVGRSDPRGSRSVGAEPPTPAQELALAHGGRLVWSEEGSQILHVDDSATSTAYSVDFEVPPRASVPRVENGMIVSAWDGDAMAMIASDGSTSLIAHSDNAVGNVAWSRDGSSYAYEVCSESDCTLRIASASSPDLEGTAATTGLGVDWGPNSSVTFIGPSGSLAQMTLGSAPVDTIGPDDVASSLGEPLGSVRLIRPQWSPSGDFIAMIAELSNGYRPIIVSQSGQFIASGVLDQYGPPDIAWRSTGQDLFYAIGPREGDWPSPFESSLRLLQGPGWGDTLVMSIQGNEVHGIFASPTDDGVVWQTQDLVALNDKEGVGPTPLWWTAVGQTQVTDRYPAPGVLLGWQG